jgi:hypothetical protein
MGWLANPVSLAIHVVPPGLTREVGRRSDLDRLGFQDDHAGLPYRPCKPSKATWQAIQGDRSGDANQPCRPSMSSMQAIQGDMAGDPR